MKIGEWNPWVTRRACRRRSAITGPPLAAALPVAADLPVGPGPYQAERQAAGRRAPQPTLYLHGSADGCIGVDLVRDAERYLGQGLRDVPGYACDASAPGS